jgi:hypothetical protein
MGDDPTHLGVNLTLNKERNPMSHNGRGKLLLQLAALVALLVVALGVLSVLVAHADPGGTITIEKQTVPPGGMGFEFTDDIPGGPSPFYLDDNEQQTFLDVSGTYAVTETNPAVIPGGWILTNVECWAVNDITWKEYTVASTTVIIELENQQVECIFTNERRPPPVVGGYVVPVNKLELLAPWLAIVGLASLTALSIALVRRRRAA